MIRTRKQDVAPEVFTETPKAEVHQWTASRIQEMRSCLDNPEYFIKHYLFTPNKTQENLIRSFNQERVVMRAVDRGVGTTSAGLAYVLWQSLFNFDKASIVVAQSHMTLTDMNKKLREMLNTLPQWMQMPLTYMRRDYLEFDNGSRIRFEVASGHTARGCSYNLMFIDNAFCIGDPNADYLRTVIMPMAAVSSASKVFHIVAK
jgi:hypothetical protein